MNTSHTKSSVRRFEAQLGASHGQYDRLSPKKTVFQQRDSREDALSLNVVGTLGFGTTTFDLISEYLSKCRRPFGFCADDI